MAATFAAPPANETTRRAHNDVALQRRYDNKRNPGWPVYQARIQAVQDARQAVDQQLDPAAKYALRQALIDLAACAEQLAAGMRAPTVRLQTDLPR
jgi:hypothetical protein